jgi:hypothetical protein
MGITLSGSLDITGSLFLNGTAVSTGSGGGGTTDTGSLLVTASISDATTTYTKGNGSTFALTTNNVQNASTASIATSASFATNALTASFALSTNLGTSATASFTGSTWTFDHNLNQSYLIIDCYDSNNEEIIPQTIDLTTANQAVITFPTSVQGTAVASIGNGVTSTGGGGATAEQLWGSTIMSNLSKWAYTQDYTYTPTNEQIITVHVSQSGIHLVDLTSVTTSASINILYYPESLPTYSAALVAFKVPAFGSAVTRGVYRSQITASNSTQFWNSTTPASFMNATSQNVQTVATNVEIKRAGNSSAQPNVITKGANNTEIYLTIPTVLGSAANYLYSGSLGTPIV